MNFIDYIINGFPYVLNLLFAIIVIFIEKRDVSTTLAWIMVLFFIPYLGFVLYVFFGQSLHKQKIFTLKKNEDTIFNEYIVENKNHLEKTKTFSISDFQEYKNMMLMHINHSKAPFSENNSIQIYTDGDEKFSALLDAINNAKENIHICYYIIKNDELGNRILDALVKKAKEGVDVKVLYDELGSRTLRESFFKPLVKAGGEYAVFFPSYLKIINFRINYRNHRKIVVIDNEIGFTGGFNIGDEYLGKKKKFGYWRDTHIKIEGEAVISLQLRFILDWRYAAKDRDFFNLCLINSSKNAGNVGIQIITSGPDSEWELIKYGFLQMIQNAKKTIYIQTPYLILDDSIKEAIKIASLSGVDVRIMIPNKPDHPFVYWVTYYNAGELIKCGVKIYTYEKGFLHAKTIVVDQKVCSVGSTNMDIRSFKLDFEVNAFIYDTAVSVELFNIFLNDINDCAELTTEKYNNRSLLIKTKESFSRLLSQVL